MPDGILIIDKPTGWTSMDVCAKLRGILREKRIGHAGTLDPMATGVLPVFVGRATKAVQFAENGRKEYHAVLKLGMVTDTQDTTGTVLETHPVTVGADEVRAALEHFTGELLQLPPMYSALKVNGQKLYDLARQGKTVERKPRAITVYELELPVKVGPQGAKAGIVLLHREDQAQGQVLVEVVVLQPDLTDPSAMAAKHSIDAAQVLLHHTVALGNGILVSHEASLLS